VNGEVEGWVSDSQLIYRYCANSYVEGMSEVRTMCDLRFLPWSSWELRSSGLLHSK